MDNERERTRAPVRVSAEEENDPDQRWKFLLALAAVAVIVVVGFLLVWKMWQNEKMQACLITGRRDCAPIQIPEGR